MGVLRISHELMLDDYITDLMFGWLEDNCDAEFSDPYINDELGCVEFYVTGEDIPKGSKAFWLKIKILVPGVMAIEIQS